MRLSDIKGERTLDVIADLIEPIANIASDEEAAKMFKREKAPGGIDPRAFAVERLKKGVPSLLKGHKKDVIVILATIEGIPPEEYVANMNLAKLAKDCFDLITDEEFSNLFISAMPGDMKSGSASPTTEAPEA